jgi:D-alanyl-D-alanine carboxypeptidase
VTVIGLSSVQAQTLGRETDVSKTDSTAKLLQSRTAAPVDYSRSSRYTLRIDDFYAPLPEGTDVLQWYYDQLNQDSNPPSGTVQLTSEPELPNLFLAAVPAGQSAAPLQPSLGFQSAGPAFSIDEFEQNIRDAILTEAVGSVYALNLNGQFARGDGLGLARNDEDGLKNQSVYKRMNIASISKTLTAVAVLQLLGENGLSIDSPVGPWLPEQWSRGLGFDDSSGEYTVTFRDLLTHRSGVAQSIEFWADFDSGYGGETYDFDGLREMVEYGILAGFHGNAKYKNANYALFRVIIPALWAASGGIPEDSELSASDAAALYQSYMAVKLFIPLGINQATCNNSNESNPTLYYNIYDSSGSGAAGGNWSLLCGSGGWYLSAYDLANVMANIRYNDEILSPTMREQMDDLFLGWSESWSYGGDHGLYRAHAGALYFDDEDFGDRREMQECIMKFSIEVEAVLMVNSSVVDQKYPCTILGNAFDNAWVD